MVKRYVAVIQAGGKGTRMATMTHEEIPKPMLSLGGKPMLLWQVENLKKYGFKEFIFIIGYLGEKIRNYFESGRRFGVHIRYLEENSPLGSGGALCLLKEMVEGADIFLVFGDVMFDINVPRLLEFHRARKADVTLIVHPNTHPQDSDLVIMDDTDRIVCLDFAQKRDYLYDNCVNAGIYVFSNYFIQTLGKPACLDLEKEVILPRLEIGYIYGYRTSEYVRDAGTVQRFQIVEQELLKGIWKKRNLENKQRCVFVDRDGTLNVHRGLICRPEDIELEEGAVEAVSRLNASGFLVILVTNQSVVARGMCTIETVKNIHRKIVVLLGEHGAYLDDIIFCPHHPDKGYPEEKPEYKVQCDCRKPATGMIDKMARRYHIDLSRSWIIGDTTVDVMTGCNAGMHTVLVKTGEAGKDEKYKVKADVEARNFLDAVNYILARESET